MTTPFFETGAPPIQQAEVKVLAEGHRLQGIPCVRWVPRETKGGGFGDPDAHPFAWGVWVMADGRWRRIGSARGNPREWTSLDRVHAWLGQLGFSAFTVMRP